MPAGAADLLIACANPCSKGTSGTAAHDVAHWPDLIDAAEFHSLLPLLYSKIGRNGTHHLPDAVRLGLHRGYVASAKRSLFLAASLADLSARFEAAQIPMLALKGPPLAEYLYADAPLRSSSDLDLLIRPADIAATLALLRQHGYELPPHLARLSVARLARFDCEAVLQHPRAVPIELHWAMAPSDFPFRFDAEVLWRSRRVASIAGRDVGVLSPECLLLYLCVHGAKHAWSRLYLIGDVARLVGKGVDWQEVQALAVETACQRPLALGLLLARELLDAAVPDGLLASARSDAVLETTAGETIERLRRMPPIEPSSTARTAYNARLARTTSDRIRHWAAMFKAPKEEDLKRCSLPPWLFFLYYPLRVQRLAAKHARRLAGGREG